MPSAPASRLAKKTKLSMFLFIFLPPIEINHLESTDRALSSTGLWRDLVNEGGVEGLRDGRQLCLKFFIRMESGQSVGGVLTVVDKIFCAFRSPGQLRSYHED